MNIYKVYGVKSDSQFGYTISVTLFADNEEEAIEIAYKDGELSGKPTEWRVELVEMTKRVFDRDEYEY